MKLADVRVCARAFRTIPGSPGARTARSASCADDYVAQVWDQSGSGDWRPTSSSRFFDGREMVCEDVWFGQEVSDDE